MVGLGWVRLVWFGLDWVWVWFFVVLFCSLNPELQPMEWHHSHWILPLHFNLPIPHSHLKRCISCESPRWFQVQSGCQWTLSIKPTPLAVVHLKATMQEQDVIRCQIKYPLFWNFPWDESHFVTSLYGLRKIQTYNHTSPSCTRVHMAQLECEPHGCVCFSSRTSS